MIVFEIGDRVTLDMNRASSFDHWSKHVLNAFKGETPIGVIVAFHPTRDHSQVFVDWGIRYREFHKGNLGRYIPNNTGYWVYKRDLTYLTNKYDPSQEPEDDCL